MNLTLKFCFVESPFTFESILWQANDLQKASSVDVGNACGRFSCDLCGKKFRHRDSLKHHWSSHRGQTVCPICQKVFGRLFTMKRHIMRMHPV